MLRRAVVSLEPEARHASRALERAVLPCTEKAKRTSPRARGTLSRFFTLNLKHTLAESPRRAERVTSFLRRPGAAATPGFVVFYERDGSTDKTLKLYEGHYRDLPSDVGKELVMSDIRAWLGAHSPTSS